LEAPEEGWVERSLGTEEAFMAAEDWESCLRATPFCDPRDPALAARAREVAGDRSGREAATALFGWVREEIEYRILGLESAGATLRRGAGCCLAKSNLLIALARARGIPARYVSFEGCLHSPRPEISAQRLVHIIPELFVEGAWMAGDPAYEAGLAAVYETGELGKRTWSAVKAERRWNGLPRWLWAAQRLAIWITPGSWKVRRAVRDARVGIRDGD
jgi:transglutaminase-like putative cysteine protease